MIDVTAACMGDPPAGRSAQDNYVPPNAPPPHADGRAHNGKHLARR